MSRVHAANASSLLWYLALVTYDTQVIDEHMLLGRIMLVHMIKLLLG